MDSEPLSIEEARREFIRLIEEVECEITGKAEREGREILKRRSMAPTQRALFEFVLKVLKSDCPLHAASRARSSVE